MQTAVCNELFGGLDFASSCTAIADAGFDGVEIAPFTLAPETGVPDRAATRATRAALAGAGLAFAGLHWLLARPGGLNVVDEDPGVRARSWAHLHSLLEFAGELGGGNLIFGSPAQRTLARGLPRERGLGRFADGLAALAGHARAHGCRVLIEALPSRVTNLVNTLDEAKALVDRIDHPSVGFMFDFHNTADERHGAAELVRRYGTGFGHVHLNTADGGYPGTEDAPAYAEAFASLHAVGYDGWVSLEIFTEPPNPGVVLASTGNFLRALGAMGG